MRLPSKITMTGKVVTAAVIVAVLIGQAAQAGRHVATSDASSRRSKPGFGMHGAVGDLYPGRHARMVVRVRNYQPFTLSLRRISVRVRRPGPHCAAGNVHVDPFLAHRRIRAHHTIRVRLRVTMKATAPNGCQGLRFPLTFRGKAVRP